jgi:hypothetical protein
MAKRMTVDAWERRQVMLAWKLYYRNAEGPNARKAWRAAWWVVVRLGGLGLTNYGRPYRPTAF